MSDRLRDAFSSILTLLIPKLAYYAQWEYTVLIAAPGEPTPLSSAGGSTLGTPTLITCIPVNPLAPVPPLAGVKMWPGPSGISSNPAPGSKVIVRFNDADPGKPSICATDPDFPNIVLVAISP